VWKANGFLVRNVVDLSISQIVVESEYYSEQGLGCHISGLLKVNITASRVLAAISAVCY
jgi:hypothetical protein